MPPPAPPVGPITVDDAKAFLRKIGFAETHPRTPEGDNAISTWMYSKDPEWLKVSARRNSRGLVHTLILYVPYTPQRYGTRGLRKGTKNPKHEIRFPAPPDWQERAQRWLDNTGSQHILRAKKQRANAAAIAAVEDREQAQLGTLLDEAADRMQIKRLGIVPVWSEKYEGTPRHIIGVDVTFRFRGDVPQIMDQIRTRFPND